MILFVVVVVVCRVGVTKNVLLDKRKTRSGKCLCRWVVICCCCCSRGGVTHRRVWLQSGVDVGLAGED